MKRKIIWRKILAAGAVFSHVFSLSLGGIAYSMNDGPRVLMGTASLEGPVELSAQITEDERFLKEVIRQTAQDKILSQSIRHDKNETGISEAGELSSAIREDEKILKEIVRSALQEKILGSAVAIPVSRNAGVKEEKEVLSAANLESGVFQDEKELRAIMGDTVKELAMSGQAVKKAVPSKSILARAEELKAGLKKELSKIRMRSSVVSGVSYESNIYRFGDQEKSDLKPKANLFHSLRLPRGESFVELSAWHNSERYLHAKTHYRYTDFRVTSFYRPSNIFNWELDYDRQITSDLNRLDTSFQDRSEYNSRHKLINKNVFTSVFTYMPGGRYNLMHVTLQQEDVTCGPLDNPDDETSERNVYKASFDFERYINPITSVFLGMDFNYLDYKSWGRNSVRNRDWFVGFRRDLSGLTKLVFRYDLNALTKKSTPESSAHNEQQHTVRFDISHRLSPFTSLSPYYTFQRRNTNDKYWRWFSHESGFNLNHFFLNGLSANFGSSVKMDLYSESDANMIDNESARRIYYNVNTGLNYRLSDWCNFGLGYSLSMGRGPSLLDGKYVDNIYTVELRGDF